MCAFVIHFRWERINDQHYTQCPLRIPSITRGLFMRFDLTFDTFCSKPCRKVFCWVCSCIKGQLMCICCMETRKCLKNSTIEFLGVWKSKFLSCIPNIANMLFKNGYILNSHGSDNSVSFSIMSKTLICFLTSFPRLRILFLPAGPWVSKSFQI